jgi:hypothetical protein
MKLTATIQNEDHAFEVTALTDTERLYFLISMGEELILAHRPAGENWQQAGAGNISQPLMNAIFSKIEDINTSVLLDNVTSFPNFLKAA